MKDLTRTASILDKLLNILSVFIKIGGVALVVGLIILGAGFVFDLPPQMIGTGYEHADLGFVTLTVADAYLPDHQTIWKLVGIEMLLTLFCLISAFYMVKAVRQILEPMKMAQPFHNIVSTNLKKLARYSCVLGIKLNLMNIISKILVIKAYDLHILLLSERIPQLEFHLNFDLSFLFIAAVLLLLSYIFRYGEELQQLSDETL